MPPHAGRARREPTRPLPRLSMVALCRSTDRGNSWEYLSTVSTDHEMSETAVAQLADGRLVLIARPEGDIAWSDDGGHTWSNEHWRGIGAIGDYTNRVNWKRLGRSRNRIYRLSVTDAVKRVLMGAHLEAEVGRG